MLDLHELGLSLRQYKEKISELRLSLNIDNLVERKEELEAESLQTEFWQNPDSAQQKQTILSKINKKIETFNTLFLAYENIVAAYELLQESINGDLFSDEEIQELAQESSQNFDDFVKKYEEVYLQTLFVGEYDDKNAVLTLHAGAGGTEAQDWVEMLYRMYLRFAENHDFAIKLLDYQEGDVAGIKTVSFLVSGDYAYGYLRSEMGVHRLVRISPFDSSGRRHTSFASLEVIPELDESIEINIRSEDLKIDTYRSSGAGGQHVNKTESAIRITHVPTGIVVSCQTERSQIQNRETAMSMLKAKLYTLAKAAHMEKIEDLRGDTMEIAWGSQIRSYVFCPYTLVKDHRTSFEKIDVKAVIDGELEDFMMAYLINDNNAKAAI